MSKKNTDKFKEWQKKNKDKNAGKIIFNVQSKSPTVVKEKAEKEATGKKKTTAEQMQDTVKQIRQTNDNLKKTETAKKAATATIQNAIANKDITPKLTRPQKSNLQVAAELQKQAALRAQYGQYNNLWEKYALLNQAYGPGSHAQSAATWAKGLGHGAETGVNNLKSGYKQGLLAFAQNTAPYLAAQQNELMSVTPNKTARAALQANAEALSNLNLEQQRRANAQQAAQKQQAINQKYGDMKGGEKVISDVVSNAIPMAPAIAGGALSGGMMSTPLFFAYGRGMGEQSALNGGASMDKANVYGLASGALEAATEALIGGIPGTKGLLDANSIVASRIGQQLFKNELAQKAGRAGIDIAGEGLEEILAGLADPYIQRQTWNPNAENATLKELLYQGALGSLTSGVFKGVNAAGNSMTNTMAGTAQDIMSHTRQGQVQNQWNAYIQQQQQLQEQQTAETERMAQENEKAEKEAEQAKNEAMNAIIARNNLLNQPSNAQNAQNGAGQAINNQAINSITGNQNAPQNANTEAVSEQNTVKNPMKLDMADRTFENVGNRNVKAYQQENPAVKPYQQEVASRLLSDLQQGIKGGMDVGIDPETRNITTRGSWQRQQSEPIEQMLQNGMTYQQIENGLNRIVEDHGKENVADAKRAELFVNDAVNKGYNSIVEGQVSYNPEAAYATMTVQDLLAERERLDNSFGEDEAFNQDLIRRMEAIDNLLYRKQTVPEQSALITHPAKLQRASDVNRQKAQQQSANKDITPKLQTAEAQQQAQQQVYEDTQAYADTQTQQQSVDDFAAYDRKRISSDVAVFLQQAEKKTGKKFDIRDGLPKSADGMCANGVIYLDGNRINSVETAHKLVTHEVYHAMRGTNEFGNLQDLAKKHLLSENQGSSMEQILQQKIAQYAKNGVQLDKNGAWDEVTADFVGEALTDTNLAERVWREQPSLGRRILEKIQSILDSFRNRKLSQVEQNQKELLEKAADTFAKGMRSMQYQEGTQSERRYSIDMNLRRQFDRWLSGKMGTDDYFNLGRTPESLKKFGANDLQIVMTQDVLVKITGGKHSIALDEIAKLPEQIASPVMLFKGSVPNSFVVLAEIKDKSGNEAIAAIHLNRYQKRMRVNRVASLYGKNNIENYVQTNIDQGNLLDVDTKKAPTWFTNRGLQLPKLVQTIINAKNNIPQNQQNFNGQSDIRYSFSEDSEALKAQQLAVIQNSNPMNDDYHTGIRDVGDILTLEEAIREDNFTPDYTEQAAQDALRKGKITVYSSYPISQGVFVTPSKMEAQNYAGSGKVYSKTVPLSDVAWIDTIEGQYAKVGHDSDVRYSLDNPQQENIDRYGAIPPGENPYGNNRDIEVPQQTADDNRVSKWQSTAAEAEQVNDQTVDALMRDLRTYMPSSNQKQLNHANNVINSVGWAEAAQSFQTRYKAGEKMTANDIAIGERCIQEAQKAGNYQKAAELIGDVAALGVELGQAVQAMSMLKRLTPEGRLMALKRVQQRINADLQQKNKKKKNNDITPKLQTAEQEQQQAQQESNQVTISPETEQRILEARGQQEMDDAWDAATQEMADQLDATLMDKVRAWRYLGMLSNIRTHIRNIVSNGVKRGVIGIEHQIEAGLETAFVKEGGERYRTFKKVPKEYKEFAEWDFETNIRRLMEQTGSRYNDAVGQINRNKRIFKPNALEKVRKTNENWLGGEDMWFKKDAYIDAFSNYLVANNLSPSVLQNNANGTSTYEAAQNYAMEKAFEATFQEANKVATFLSQIEHSSKIGEVLIGALMPFKKTPLNILKQGTMVYSPVGLVKGLTNAMTKVKSGEMTQVEAIEQISRGLTGTGIAAVGALMMSLGMIALGGDDDKRKAKYDQQMGDQTYALKFRDGSTYSIDWLSPSVMPLLMGAEIYDSVKRAYNGELTDQSMMSAVTSSLMRIGDPLLEMSCMSGLADALSSYSDGGTEAMSNIIGTSIKNYAGQFIPAPVGALARAIDDTVRSSYASKDSAIGKGNEQFLRQQRSKIPGVSMQNEASIDVWGNERKREGSNIAGRAFNNFINPGNYSSNKRTALDNELEALYQSTGDSGIFPALASSTINESKQNPKISMTPEEYSRFSTTKGKKSRQYVSDFVNSEAYDQLDDSEKADIISSLYELANYEARKQTLDKRGYDYSLSDKENVLESGVEPYEYYATKKRFGGKWGTYETVVKYAEHADKMGMDDDKYVEMNETLNGIKADKKNGKTVSGSRQKKVKEYLNRELNAGNITKEQWWYWYSMEYPTQAKNSPYAWQRRLHDDTESTTAQQQTDKGKANQSIQAVTTLQRPKR